MRGRKRQCVRHFRRWTAGRGWKVETRQYNREKRMKKEKSKAEFEDEI